MSKPADDVIVYKEQVHLLEAEVESLKTRIDARAHLFVSSKSLPSLNSELQKEIFDSEGDKDTDDLIINLCKEIFVLKTFTDVEIYDVTGFPLDNSAPDSLDQMHYTVKGSSHDVMFNLSLKVFQTENGVIVKNFEIDSIDSVNSDLGPVFDNLESGQWLQGFLGTFVPYTKLRSERRQAFCNVEEKFGNFVKLPDGICGSKITFHHKTEKEITFEIKWDFKVASSYEMSHVITLNVEAPLTGKKNKILKNAPDNLNRMIESLGPEPAIEAFIRASVLGETVPPPLKEHAVSK